MVHRVFLCICSNFIMFHAMSDFVCIKCPILTRNWVYSVHREVGGATSVWIV